MNRKLVLVVLLLIFILAGLIFSRELFSTIGNSFFALTAQPIEDRSPLPTISPTTTGNGDSSEVAHPVELVAEDLNIPWEIAFLPDESLLVTERPGTVMRILPNERKRIPISGVEHVGEGGLLGLVLHPEYEQNRWIYLYHTTRTSQGLINRVERYEFDEATNMLSNQQIILDNIPASSNHDGGRLAFGLDNLLYITTGDAGNQASAQDTQSLAGKILRLQDDGSIPSDNPFGNEVYSYGHRNPQGLSWDNQGRLWATEHGPSGTGSGFDEVNLVQKGANYGWPDIQGQQTQSGMIAPVMQSGGDETWAPADVLVIDSFLVFPGLRGQALYSTQITGSTLQNRVTHLQNQYGRLRATVLSPDQKWIYLATSNRDGRGRATAGDDKIIRVSTQWLLSEQR
jgi:glucose/arabinose dehydrogenase